MSKRDEEKLEVEVLGMRVNQRLSYKPSTIKNLPKYQYYETKYSYTFLVELETKVYYEVTLYEEPYTHYPALDESGKPESGFRTGVSVQVKPSTEYAIESMSYLPKVTVSEVNEQMIIKIPMYMIDAISEAFKDNPAIAEFDLIIDDDNHNFASDAFSVYKNNETKNTFFEVAFENFSCRYKSPLKRPVYIIITNYYRKAYYYLPQLLNDTDHSVAIIRHGMYIPDNITDDIIIIECDTPQKEQILQAVNSNIIGEYEPIIIRV